MLDAYRKEDEERPLDDGSTKLEAINACAASLMLVEELFFRVLGIPADQVKVHKGWFQDTLPTVVQSGRLHKISVLRLDGDWYESTKTCLTHLYPRVQPGGFVLIDDYGYFEGCRKAVDEYLSGLTLRPELKNIDSDGVYFRKPIPE